MEFKGNFGVKIVCHTLTREELAHAVGAGSGDAVVEIDRSAGNGIEIGCRGLRVNVAHPKLARRGVVDQAEMTAKMLEGIESLHAKGLVGLAVDDEEGGVISALQRLAREEVAEHEVDQLDRCGHVDGAVDQIVSASEEDVGLSAVKRLLDGGRGIGYAVADRAELVHACAIFGIKREGVARNINLPRLCFRVIKAILLGIGADVFRLAKEAVRAALEGVQLLFHVIHFGGGCREREVKEGRFSGGAFSDDGFGLTDRKAAFFDVEAQSVVDAHRGRVRADSDLKAVGADVAEDALGADDELQRGTRRFCAEGDVFDSARVVCHKTESDRAGIVAAINGQILADVELRNVAALHFAGALVHGECQNGLVLSRLKADGVVRQADDRALAALAHDADAACEGVEGLGFVDVIEILCPIADGVADEILAVREIENTRGRNDLGINDVEQSLFGACLKADEDVLFAVVAQTDQILLGFFHALAFTGEQIVKHPAECRRAVGFSGVVGKIGGFGDVDDDFGFKGVFHWGVLHGVLMD